MSRFYYEQDGDAPKNSSANAHYVVDVFADPIGPHATTDVPFDFSGAKMARMGRKLADRMNANPPWPPWDVLAVERSGYVCPPIKPLAELLEGLADRGE